MTNVDTEYLPPVLTDLLEQCGGDRTLALHYCEEVLRSIPSPLDN